MSGWNRDDMTIHKPKPAPGTIIHRDKHGNGAPFVECPHCGRYVSPVLRYCARCGGRLK